MSQQNLALFGVGGLVLVALVFMGWAAVRPLDPSVAVATPQLTAAVVAMTPPATTGAVGDIIATELFTMTLPDGWQWTTQAWSGEQAASAQLAPLVLAWPVGENFEQSQTRFSIAAMPRNELSLERYLLDVTEHFSDTAGAATVDARLVTDLRRDGLPAAIIAYTISSPAGEVNGYQAATFDTTGTQLLIATLVHQADTTDGERLFRTLVGSLYLPAPAN